MKKLLSLAAILGLLSASNALALTPPFPEVCGTIAGIKCPAGYKCVIAEDSRQVTDAAGKCVRPAPFCYISDKLMENYKRELDSLVKAEKLGNLDDAEQYKRNIAELREKIEGEKKRCKTVAPPSTVTGSGGSLDDQPEFADWCGEALGLEKKIKYYENLNNLGDEEIAKIIGQGRKVESIRELIKTSLEQLPRALERARTQCQTTKTKPGDTTPAVELFQQTDASFKPIIPESAQELQHYYKTRIAVITNKEEGDANQQFKELKDLHQEIDELIARLLRSQQEIETSDLAGLVAIVKIRPGVVEADGVTVEVSDSKFRATIKDTPIVVKQIDNKVVIEAEELSVDAPEVTVESGRVTVTGKEIKLTPKEAVEKSGGEAVGMILQTFDDALVYEVNTRELRKLFGFIPIKVTKRVRVEAQNGEIVRVDLPWYSFLTTQP